MKILFVSANTAVDPFPVYPLGMTTVAAALEEHGHTVHCYDPLAEQDSAPWNILAETIRAFHPDVIGIAIRNIDSINRLADDRNLLHPVIRMAECCKTNAPATPLVLGGGGFTLAPDSLLKLCHADYGLTGPGEHTFPALLEQLASGTPPDAPLLCGDAPVAVPRSAVYPEELLTYYNNETHMIPIQTKRGCPFSCAYCSYPALEGRCMRYRDPAETAAEMRAIAAQCPGVMIFFTDSIFNDPAKEYHKLLHELDGTIPFTGFLTPYKLTGEDISLLAEKGMISAELGIDGASDRALQTLGKNFLFAEAAECAEKLRDAGISVTANFLFGLPDETVEDVEEGIANIKSLGNISSVIFSGVRIIPHTPLYHRAEEENLIPADWDPSEELYYPNPALPPEILNGMLSRAFAEDPNCIFPPHSKREALAKIHKFGFAKLKKLFPGEMRP